MKKSLSPEQPLLKTTYGMRLLAVPAAATPDIYQGVSANALARMQLNKRRLKQESQMSTAKKQKEAHEFKLLADKEALYLSMREKRRAQRNITNIGNTAEQDVDSTDNEDKEVIKDIKTINNEIYQLKI